MKREANVVMMWKGQELPAAPQQSDRPKQEIQVARWAKPRVLRIPKNRETNNIAF
jgi:hypothetical protein